MYILHNEVKRRMDRGIAGQKVHMLRFPLLAIGVALAVNTASGEIDPIRRYIREMAQQLRTGGVH
jgi:hypothetical protein